ncbi:hypothetical protein BST81_22225 [Leptolyngbya sp. 'hensonii']|uniref:DUF642 domain-containing protein n=1 Tax=Leptolyngbya sp. 'hensonii' TaxID=1922337 RepID=UPI00094FA090|nr:DUF642 domain-containing protein [Leptolyngbya sp. 'hensonii']OLP16314.1 hypothetical protein BST81_22225 [Leptolyngbya sp. 'hensonii']
MLKQLVGISIALGITGIIFPAQAATLISNGSFESSSQPSNYAYLPGNSQVITGWKTILGGVEWFNPEIALSAVGVAPDGSFIVDLVNDYVVGGGIEQTLATSVGQQYHLSFYGGTSRYSGRSGTGEIEVMVGNDSHTFNLFTNSSGIDWQLISFAFVATTPATTITFRNFQNQSHFAFIDNVKVEAIETVTRVPEPMGLLSGLIAIGPMLRPRQQKVAKSGNCSTLQRRHSIVHY